MTEKTLALSTEKQAALSPTGQKSLATRDESLYVAPPVDIYETDDAIVVIVDLPGVDKDNMDVRVEDNILTIKGRSAYSPPAELLREEFSLHGYFRQFQLSDEVDQNKITAESRNGVLTITLPKVERSKPKQIEVKLG